MAVLGRNYARARLTSEHARVPVAVAARPTPELLPNAVYPLGKTRELTPTEVAIVRRWRAEGVSGNVICRNGFSDPRISSVWTLFDVQSKEVQREQ